MRPSDLAQFEVILRVSQLRWLADDVEHGEVVLPAGRHAVQDDVRDRHMCRGERRLGVGLGGFRGFDLLGECFGALQ